MYAQWLDKNKTGLLDTVVIKTEVPKKHKVRKYKKQKPRKYKEYITSSAWKHKKQTLLGNKPFCAACGSSQYISGHHTNYKRVGVEVSGDIVALCSSCHKEFHMYVKTSVDMVEPTQHFIQAKHFEQDLSFPSF